MPVDSMAIQTEKSIQVFFYDFDVDKQRDQIASYFSMLEELQIVPYWINRINVYLSMNNPEGYLSACSSMVEYGIFRLTIFPDFFSTPDTEHLPILIHEFIHAYHHSLLYFVRDTIIGSIQDNQQLVNYFTNEFNSRVEKFTEDITNVIYSYVEDKEGMKC